MKYILSLSRYCYSNNTVFKNPNNLDTKKYRVSLYASIITQ